MVEGDQELLQYIDENFLDQMWIQDVQGVQ